MTLLLAFLLLADPAAKPDEPQPIEKILASKVKPADLPFKVQTHLLVHRVDGKKGVAVKFIDAKPSPNVHVKLWDPKVKDLKPETTILVTGDLHIGPVKGGTPSIRYKVVDAKGKKYNDHQHWRTDKAIYIVNPTFEVVEEKNN